MIIKCEQCKTKFRLDDSKVTEKGVKVRCAKCKHVFTVKKETEEQQVTAPVSDPEQISPTTAQTASTIIEQNKPATDIFQSSSSSFSFDDGETETAPSDPYDFGSVQLGAPPQPADAAVTSVAAQDDFDFSDSPAASNFVPDDIPSPVKFDDFDFGADEHSVPEPSEPGISIPTEDISDLTGKINLLQEETEPTDSSQSLDFSDDDMFGKVVPPAVEEQGDHISFDFGDDSFADAMELGKSDNGMKSEQTKPESSGDTPFSLDDIDFGDELTSVAVQQVNPDDLKTSQKDLFSPLAETEEKKAVEENSVFGAMLAEQEELPPLSISSRRKQSSFITWLVSGVAVLAVAGLGYLGFTTMSNDKGTSAKENGKITVRSIMASYVDNKSIGKLLVISGEALNEYPLPRAALQVKGSVINAAGQGVAAKTVYCGNPLTMERLSTMSLENIESAMANQFGDSLSNLEVAPGKAIPFTIVIPKPPADGKDFTVEPAGSTVASSKQ